MRPSTAKIQRSPGAGDQEETDAHDDERALDVDRHRRRSGLPTELAGEHLHARVAGGGSDRQEQVPPRDATPVDARRHHHPHADQTDHDGGDAGRTDGLTEHRDRQQGDEQRRHEEQRCRCPEGHHGEGGEEGHVGDHDQSRAQRVESRPVGAQQ